MPIAIAFRLCAHIQCYPKHRQIARAFIEQIHQRVHLSIAELDAETYDEEVEKKINIGFPQLRVPRTQETKIQYEYLKKLRKDSTLEKKARSLECKTDIICGTLEFLVNLILISVEIDLKDVRKEWFASGGNNQIKTIATHYGVFKDLFGYANFTPRLPLSIKVGSFYE